MPALEDRGERDRTRAGKRPAGRGGRASVMPAAYRGLIGLMAFGLGIALGREAATPRPDAPPASVPWTTVSDRLFLGRAIPGGGFVSDQEVAHFLDEVASPRLDGGLTAWRGDGRWTAPDGRLVREPVLVLEVVHEVGDRADSALVAIAREYKRRFQQAEILRVITPNCTLSYE